MQVLIFLCMFMMFTGTYVFQVGLISVLLQEFRAVIIVSVLYLLAFLAYGAVKAVLIFGSMGNLSQEQFWSDPGFFAAASVAKVVAVVYYLLIVDAIIRLGRVSWYHRAPWVSGFRDALS